MGVYIPYSRLPSEYQEVEYIQSSGTQWIDTLHQHTANSKVGIKFSYQSMSTRYNLLFGSRSRYNVNDAFSIFIENSSTISLTIGGKIISPASTSANTIYNISFSKDYFIINGATTTLNSSLTSYGYNDLLFNFMENGQSISGCNPISAKVYYCRIYEGSTLVRDLVPCYRKSDTVIGMYDLVNNQFYTNSGTGTFSKGNDVTMSELQNAYIGEVWTPTSNTLAYYEFEGNLNDSSGNGNNIVSTSNFSYQSEGGQYVGKITAHGTIVLPPLMMSSIGSGDFTISFFFYQGTYNSNQPQIFGIWEENGSLNYRGPTIIVNRNNGGTTLWRTQGGSAEHSVYTTGLSMEANKWHHWVMTRRSGVVYCYVDATLLGQFNSTDSMPTTSDAKGQFIGRYINGSNGIEQINTSMGDKLIIEKVGWTSDKITNYFNTFKSIYGIG